jgi:glucose-1-phosphate adenylyltransferase
MKDFGKDVIPAAVARKRDRVFAYKYDGYWEDIGTIGSFYAANLLLVDPSPPFDLYNPEFPLYTRPRFLPPSRFESSRIDRVLIADGCVLRGCEVVHSIIGIRSTIGAGTRISDSIILGHDQYEYEGDRRGAARDPGRVPQGIGPDCEIRRAIIDKNARIGRGVKIVNATGASDLESERWTIRDGIVVIPKDTTIPDGTVI